MTSHNCFHVARQTCSSNHRLVSNYSFRASCILPHLLPLRKGASSHAIPQESLGCFDFEQMLLCLSFYHASPLLELVDGSKVV